MEFALDRFKMQCSRLVGLFSIELDQIVLKCNAEGLSRADTSLLLESNKLSTGHLFGVNFQE